MSGMPGRPPALAIEVAGLERRFGDTEVLTGVDLVLEPGGVFGLLGAKRNTLEGVLYTPVTDTALVVGKIVGAVLPAVVVSWVCFGVYTVLVNVLGNPLVGHWYFPTLNWWVLMLLVVPAVATFVTACVVWVSARVSSYQSANSIAGFAVLPLILLVVGQATGVMLLGPALFAVLGAVLVVLDVLMMRWVIATFDREKVVASFL